MLQLIVNDQRFDPMYQESTYIKIAIRENNWKYYLSSEPIPPEYNELLQDVAIAPHQVDIIKLKNDHPDIPANYFSTTFIQQFFTEKPRLLQDKHILYLAAKNNDVKTINRLLKNNCIFSSENDQVNWIKHNRIQSQIFSIYYLSIFPRAI